MRLKLTAPELPPLHRSASNSPPTPCGSHLLVLYPSQQAPFVADEVRTLASRTQDSTQEIETIINSLQERTKKIVEHMASCRIQGQESSEQASIAGSMLEEIAQDVNTIMEMSSTIATAIHEQTTVASEVNRHVVAIRDVADQTGQESKHNAQMSEELSEQAKVLNNEVKQFKV